jgi:hypothetical protein
MQILGQRKLQSPSTLRQEKTAVSDQGAEKSQGAVSASDEFRPTERPAAEGSLKSALVKIGRQVSKGALLGFGVALATAGAATIAPMAGLAVAGTLMAAGAVSASATYGDSMAQLTGSKTLGKVVAGIAGAGMVALCAGTGPISSVVTHSLKGLGMGALFGLITAPKS